MNRSVQKFIATAQRDEPVYISDVRDAFEAMHKDECFQVDLLLIHCDGATTSAYSLRVPRFGVEENASNDFVRRYLHANIYNILSTLGGQQMQILVDTGEPALLDVAGRLSTVFMVDSPSAARQGYGRCINVADRMLRAVQGHGDFSFRLTAKPRASTDVMGPARPALDLSHSALDMGGRLLLGMDIGGTQIKCLIVHNGHILGLKTYDWFPATFTLAGQLLSPIRALTRVCAYYAGYVLAGAPKSSDWDSLMDNAMSDDADLQTIQEAIDRLKAAAPFDAARFDGIGIGYPDVVIQNKIIGGEVYKSRGIRENPAIDYEEEFKKITNLDTALCDCLKKDGIVRITNDAHIAAYAAAVEKGCHADAAEPFFAHTLGTELGSGFVEADGSIPDIPLELYNYIIDLGSWRSATYCCDDLRSTVNFNTGLPGTVQKYTSQSGVFRLAMKRPELVRTFIDQGFIHFKSCERVKTCLVQTAPRDMRKAFLAHILTQADDPANSAVHDILREIGVSVAVMILESERILGRRCKRILFGGLVARPSCFRLIREGARSCNPRIQLEAADSNLCNTPLMKELACCKGHSLAHVAQVVGAVHYANAWIRRVPDNDLHLRAKLAHLQPTDRIKRLKARIHAQPRRFSIEQAVIITHSYQATEGKARIIRRAKAFAASAEQIRIAIDPDELIVGNRTAEIRAGVVFPEAGIGWIADELDTLDARPQDPFLVQARDKRTFLEEIQPYWEGKTLEDRILSGPDGQVIKRIAKVAKINQKDHAQGHIVPDVRTWLSKGPRTIAQKARARLEIETDPDRKLFYQALAITHEAACAFIRRYADRPEADAAVTQVCRNLSERPPETFHEALQALWFLFVLLQLESNASSFSPGRADQYLLPYLKRDLAADRITLDQALELVEALWIKFNQIVYMRNANSASYFAGFPIGFNIALGGKAMDGSDCTNIVSYLMLKAQEHVGLPQPNLSVRLHRNSPAAFLNECSRVIGLGSGMPQVFNDESIIPALESIGISPEHAGDYAVTGCVEITTSGNNLGWSDAAMFNMVKALELALNNGKCLLTGEQLGPQTGYLSEFSDYQDVENAFAAQIAHFVEPMMQMCAFVDRMHAELLPSPFLSGVVQHCMDSGVDVTAGGALYNYSGIQCIQGANIADSLAALKKAVFEDRRFTPADLQQMLKRNFEGADAERAWLLNQVPKYGNDVPWVDELAHKWIRLFADQIATFTNARGGRCHTGLYTVSAHVPMGANVGATPDGRLAGTPLADGGMSAVYGRDTSGPTALLHSVSRTDSRLGSNGTLLNMKFLPDVFRTAQDIEKFSSLLRAIVSLRINHAQFNVLNEADLIAAKETPELYKSLCVRVAGYTAYFTELSPDLQDEIIARTTYGK